MKKIISGGQTGADRAALDWAIAHQIPHGGWCPKGRLAEDGHLDFKYHLTETIKPNYAERTAWNVRDSDATVIFTLQPTLIKGSQWTLSCTQTHQKPCLHLAASQFNLATESKFLIFLHHHQVNNLNVAGSRKSEEREIEEWVTMMLNKITQYFLS